MHNQMLTFGLNRVYMKENKNADKFQIKAHCRQGSPDVRALSVKGCDF